MIVCEKTKDPWGDYLENLGTFNPRVEPVEIRIKPERIQHWIAKGAQCSETVWNLLVDQGIVKGEKRRNIRISKKRSANLQKESEAKKAAEEAKKAAEAEAKRAQAEAAKAEAEAAEAAAKAQAEAEAAAKEAPASEPVAEAPAEEVKEEPAA